MWLFLVGGFGDGWDEGELGYRSDQSSGRVVCRSSRRSFRAASVITVQQVWCYSVAFRLCWDPNCLSLTLGPCSQAFWRLPTDLIVRTRAVWAKHSSSHVLINELLASGSKLAWGVAHEGSSVGWSVAIESCKLKGHCWQDARCSLNASPGLVFVFFCKRHRKLDANSNK